MQELSIMFLPEYSITPKILERVSKIEYARSVIENTTILPSWETQLVRDTNIKLLKTFCLSAGINLETNKAKSIYDKIQKPNSQEIENIIETIWFSEEINSTVDFDEELIRQINKSLTANIAPDKELGAYRIVKEENKVPPQEILANIVQLFDWWTSLDAQETHPLIKTSILKGSLEIIKPFKIFNDITADLATRISMKNSGYNFRGFICFEDLYKDNKREYEQHISSLSFLNRDFTEWIEYFIDCLSLEVSNVKEQVKLLAKDTKIAKVTGRAKFTPRQERIVEYLQDFGTLQNKDFTKVFPDVSEDSVLRDLKVLIEKEVVIKTGSTKSSRYELS